MPRVTEPPGFQYLWGTGCVNLAPFLEKCKPLRELLRSRWSVLIT